MRVPKLRFPEFQGEYSCEKLETQVDFKGGYAFSSKNMSNSPKKYQLIKMSNVYMNKLRLDRNPSYWEEVSSKEKAYILKKGDVILTLTGTVGKRDYGYSTTIEEEERFLLNQRLVRIRGKNKLSSSKFIKYLVLNERFLYNFFANSKGGTGNQSNASVEDIKKIQLYFPLLPEQEKIANFLSSVDSKIEKLEDKKEKLEEYKKGIMQAIFSRGENRTNNLELKTKKGEKIRFKPDFDSAQSTGTVESYPDWEEKRLGEVASFSKGKGLPKSEIVKNGKYKCIHYGELFLKYNEKIASINNYTNVIEKMVLSENNDILMPTSDVTPNGLATASSLKEDGVILGGDILIIRSSKLDSLYFSYYVGSHKKDIMKLVSGTTVFHLYGSDMSTLKIFLPCFVEQQKIANFLSSLDDKIEKVGNEIDGMKEWKKGLLQQLFI